MRGAAPQPQAAHVLPAAVQPMRRGKGGNRGGKGGKSGKGSKSIELVSEEQPSRTVVGVPPSKEGNVGRGKKYGNIGEYSGLKRAKQETREHVAYDLVAKPLQKASGEANNVTLVLKIGDGESILLKPGEGSTRWVNVFQTPFSSHNHEMDTSKNDAEVELLSAAYDHCFTDLHQHAQTDGQRSHQIALIGPWGPCDGCKERIRAFKREWKELAAEANCSAILVVTCFYRHEGQTIQRQGETFYGYHEALEGEGTKLPQLGNPRKGGVKEGEYWYRTTGATSTHTPPDL